MCAAENAPARDGRPRTAAAAVTGGVAAAVVRLLAVAVCGRVAAAAPASVQGTGGLTWRLNRPDFNRYEGDCPVSVQLGQRTGGGMLVTVSAPGRCRCEELTLSVLQHRGIPCAPDAERCAWMTAHTASPDSRGAATFLVSVDGLFRPRALCRPPRAGEAKSDRPSMLRLFDGDPVHLAGVDLSSWNVSISASVRGEVLEVRVRKQQHSGRTVSYFPQLVVTLYGPPESPGYPAPRLDQRSVAFLPETHGARAEFPVPPGGLYDYGYRVDVRPGGSWVCRGANEGCQRRYAMVQELLELTEQARSDGSIVS